MAKSLLKSSDFSSAPTILKNFVRNKIAIEGCSEKTAGEYLLDLILKAVPLAMGIAVTVIALLGELDLNSGFSMLGIGLACLALRELKK